jgi:hypothetical protein
MQGIRRLRHAAAQPVPCNADKRNYQAYTEADRLTAPLIAIAVIFQAVERLSLFVVSSESAKLIAARADMAAGSCKNPGHQWPGGNTLRSQAVA